MLYALLGVLPWLALGAFMALGVREPRELPGASAGARAAGHVSPGPRTLGHASSGARGDDPTAADPPPVSVIVPARNEARNIRACVESLTRLEGVAFEVIVVDDRSTDGTGEIARALDPGRASRLRVMEGAERPAGWFGKPWACHQGAAVAEGRFLLFTDADTVHAPDLLSRALAAMDEDRASAVSLMGHQELGSFWERLIQPQVFLVMGLRFRRLDRVLDASMWRRAIANGQYVLVRREAYEAIGGHEAVRGEVVEDLRLAQELTRAGFRLSVRGATDALSTRMYTSLREVVDGWTKNLAVGARQAAGWWGGVAVPAIVGFVLVAWVLPAGVLLAAAAGGLFGWPVIGAAPAAWAGVTCLVSGGIWVAAYERFGVPRRYAAAFPLGALVVGVIALRSGIRGTRRIEWKGRTYGRVG